MAFKYLLIYMVSSIIHATQTQLVDHRVGKLQEVFAWRQISYNINGILVEQDLARPVKDFEENLIERDVAQVTLEQRQTASQTWIRRPAGATPFWSNWNRGPNSWDNEPSLSGSRPQPSPAPPSIAAAPERSFFIQYNNVPMGAEKVGRRLFITVPRRRYGIPSTLNYIDLDIESNKRSPPLRPYPNLQASKSLVSVYRTRADECSRLWMVDTGLMEIPNAPQQIQPPAIVVFDVDTDRQILRYQFKTSDIPSATTPTGLASITIDIQRDCSETFAYIPDLTTNGLIVFSLRDNDSWRLSHNFFHFSPVASTLNIAGRRFQWNDGIFSITLSQKAGDCRVAYFHPLISTQEFSVSTCVLKNRNISGDSNYWEHYSLLGDRGIDSQSTMHDFHRSSRVVFFADVGRDAVSCWHSGKLLTPSNVIVLARDSHRLSYPSDLHVTGDEVWVMANSLPRFGYSTLDVSQHNFYVYRANVRDLISGTTCEGFSSG